MLSIKVDIDVLTEATAENIAAFEASFAGSKGGEQQYRWEHEASGEGICPECAPYLYQIGTIGDFGDEPPLHLNCRCYLAPWDGEPPSAEGADAAHVNWLQSLSEDQLGAIAGSVRAKLVADGAVDVAELWDDEYKLVSLERLGFDNIGRRIKR